MNNPDSTQTVNKRVALARGWTRHEDREGIIEWSHSSRSNYFVETPPDFCGTWEHAGPLFDELRKELGLDHTWALVAEQFVDNPELETTEAITRAYDAW